MWYERNSLSISQEFKPNSTAQKVILYHGTLCPTFWSLCISYTRKICREKYIYSEEYGTRLCVVVIRVIFNMHQYLNSEVFDISHRRIYTFHSICTRCSLAHPWFGEISIAFYNLRFSCHVRIQRDQENAAFVDADALAKNFKIHINKIYTRWSLFGRKQKR